MDSTLKEESEALSKDDLYAPCFFHGFDQVCEI